MVSLLRAKKKNFFLRRAYGLKIFQRINGYGTTFAIQTALIYFAYCCICLCVGLQVYMYAYINVWVSFAILAEKSVSLLLATIDSSISNNQAHALQAIPVSSK